ncbi:MAG: ribosome maturation factor RimM [Eubacteriales bacterium]
MSHCPKAAILFQICWAWKYHADDETICYGTITDVIKTGANDVYQVTDKQQKDYLIPVIDQVVIDTDIQGRKLLIRPMKGIFEDED